MATQDISDKTVDQNARDLLGALIMLDGSTTWDASAILDGDMEAKNVTVTGAALGDFVVASLGVDVVDLTVSATVTATDTATVVLANNTGASVDLASTTVYVRVIKRGDVLAA